MRCFSTYYLTMTPAKWNCKDCSCVFLTDDTEEILFCSQCGSSRIVRQVEVSEGGVEHELLDLKCKDDSAASRKKLRRHVQTGRYVDDQGRLIEKYRAINRNTGEYQEEVVDVNTGEVLQRCKERLSAHKGHGSAKHKPRYCTKQRV